MKLRNLFIAAILASVSLLCQAQVQVSGNAIIVGGTAVGVGWGISNGSSANPASLYQTTPRSGFISKCIFTTTTSDASSNLVFDIRYGPGGSVPTQSIFSAGNATVTAGSAPAAQTTFVTFTSSPFVVTSGYEWSLVIVSGSSSWSGTLECQ